MKLPALITTDLHHTANPRDAYRWDLWPWLRKTCIEEGVQTLCILGDVTDAKDYHPNELINRLVSEVKQTLDVVPRIIIDMGNHDYLLAGHPLLAFLSAFPGVTFATRPLDTSSEGEATLFLPHSKNPAADWRGFDWSMYRWVFLHQTVDGSIASNGQRMDGDKFPDMSSAGKIYSGDIHVPQVVNGVEYVGSPYHVHFGDKFKPRCLLLDRRGKAHDLHFETLSRVMLDVLPGELLVPGQPTLGLRKGDQVKLRIHLQAAEMHEWHAIKRNAVEVMKALQVDCFGIELVAPKTRRRFGEDSGPQHSVSSRPEEVLYGFVDREGLGPDALDIGLDLLK